VVQGWRMSPWVVAQGTCVMSPCEMSASPDQGLEGIRSCSQPRGSEVSKGCHERHTEEEDSAARCPLSK